MSTLKVYKESNKVINRVYRRPLRCGGGREGGYLPRDILRWGVCHHPAATAAAVVVMFPSFAAVVAFTTIVVFAADRPVM